MHVTLSVLSELVAVAPPMAARPLPEVISEIRNWVMGILFAVATLMGTIGLVLYTLSSDPTSAEQGKAYFKRAGIGYAGAVLAPVIMEIIRGFVGG